MTALTLDKWRQHCAAIIDGPPELQTLLGHELHTDGYNME